MRSESLFALNPRGEEPHPSYPSHDSPSDPVSRHMQHAHAIGLMVFDHKGRLVAADSRAELLMAARGVHLNCGGRLRVDALATSTVDTRVGWGLPDWLHPDWIEPVIDGDERLGTIVRVPEVRRAAAHGRGGLPVYKLRQIAEFIRAHMDQQISVAQLARVASLSPFHFHREFKRSTGLTPGKYISKVRVDQAKTLLSETQLSLAQVALHVGFTDQSHFTTAFRRATSMTPRAYRKVSAIARRPLEELPVAQ
jgi:AraC-like DNA-binding protein